jgi:hypothetical protein
MYPFRPRIKRQEAIKYTERFYSQKPFRPPIPDFIGTRRLEGVGISRNSGMKGRNALRYSYEKERMMNDEIQFR